MGVYKRQHSHDSTSCLVKIKKSFIYYFQLVEYWFLSFGQVPLTPGGKDTVLVRQTVITWDFWYFPRSFPPSICLIFLVLWCYERVPFVLEPSSIIFINCFCRLYDFLCLTVIRWYCIWNHFWNNDSFKNACHLAKCNRFFNGVCHNVWNFCLLNSFWCHLHQIKQ